MHLRAKYICAISIRRREDAMHEYAAVRTQGARQPEAKPSLQTTRENRAAE